jgi:hypothetical protein
MRNVLFFCALVFACLASPAFACRPLTTDDCPVIDQGKFQIESGSSTYSYNSVDTISLMNTFTYGVTPNAQIAVDVPYTQITGAGNKLSGLSDVNIKTKIQVVVADDHLFGVSVLLGSKLNNGDDNQGLGTGQIDLFANSIITRATNFGAIHLNLGYTSLGQPSNSPRLSQLNYGVAMEYNLPAGSKLLSEISGAAIQNADGPLQFTLGINKNLADQFVLDGGAIFGLSPASPNKIYALGLTVLI